jgi:hypothetical protein
MYQLPGLAAKSTLYEFTDSYKRPFAMLHVPTTSHFTVIFSTEPDGASLVDPEQVDAWVANWGGWLAGLADEAGLDAAAVTVETAPDSGYRLRNEVLMNIDPDAPQFARDMLHEVVDTYPEGSATVRAWVSLTFNAALRAGLQEADPGGRRPRPSLPDPRPVGTAAVHRGRHRPAHVRAGTLRGRPDRLRPSRSVDH